MSNAGDDVAHDKHAIAKSFGNAAGTYNHVSGLQQRVGAALLEMLYKHANDNQAYKKELGQEKGQGIEASRLLDVGCGTGFLVNQLATDVKTVYALDIAEGMLQFAKSERADTLAADKKSNNLIPERKLETDNVHYICADAEAIPLNENSVDVVVSNFAIQWCPNKQVLFQEVARVLVPGGRFIFSMPGHDTLHELKASWQYADPQHTHVNQFCDMDEVKSDVLQSPLAMESLQLQTEVMRYQKLQELTHELKALGAHNVTDGRAKQLTGKRTLKRLISAYEDFRDSDGNLPATWNVIYGVLVNKKAI